MSMRKRPPAMPSVCMRAVMSLDERACRGLAAGRQLSGQLAVGVERLGLLLLERGQVVVGALELGQLALELRGTPNEFRG